MTGLRFRHTLAGRGACALLAALLFCSTTFQGPAHARDFTERELELGQALYSGIDSGDHTAVVDAGLALLASSKDAMTVAEREVLMGVIFSSAFNGLQQAMVRDEIPTAWYKRLSGLPIPTDPSSDAWLTYGILRGLHGVGAYNRDDFDAAAASVAEARGFIESSKATPMPGVTRAEALGSMLASLEPLEKALDSRGLGVGDYVTSGGLLQSWIGRVTARDGDRLEVVVTYARDGAQVRKGDTMAIDRSTARRLTAVSLEAAFKGWR